MEGNILDRSKHTTVSKRGWKEKRIVRMKGTLDNLAETRRRLVAD